MRLLAIVLLLTFYPVMSVQTQTPVYLKSTLSETTSNKTDLTNKQVRCKPFFGNGDSDSKVLKGYLKVLIC
jgi:hypothetical protein